MAISGAQIVSEVEKFVHDPYVYGAAGPSSFDCSGLVQYALTQLGVKGVPRTSEEQYGWVQKITQSQLLPGDLVFAQFPGDNASPGHVGIYTGNGQVLSAESPASGIGSSSLASWGNAVVGYGRVPGSAASAASGLTSASSAGSGGLLGIPAAITGFFGDLDSALGGIWAFLTALLSPSTYVRAAAGIAGVFLFVGGAWFLIKAAT